MKIKIEKKEMAIKVVFKFHDSLIGKSKKILPLPVRFISNFNGVLTYS